MARLAAEQNTIVTARQLYACGLSSGAVTLRTRRGTLHRVYRGVYSVVGEDSLTMKARLTAAVLACGDRAVLSHRSAGAWWELIAYGERHPEVTVPGDGGRAIDGIRVRRTRGLDPRDVWRREHIRVTSPARTALDIAHDVPPDALRRLLRQAQAEGRLTVNQLRDVLSRANGHHGARALRAVIADGPTPTRSVAEDVMLDLLDEAALPRPELNPRLALGATTVMPDLLWREQMLVVEVDGARFHSSAQARREDARRQALLEARGHRVIRVTYDQLVHDPEQTIARIRLALYARGR
ncbi:MAG TPA: DUF559 domain-containing protein [Solirubrobacteraceae bacterium]|nr:DUF559 domain-containing protein [Solirubrobacteraceae bacterium]